MSVDVNGTAPSRGIQPGPPAPQPVEQFNRWLGTARRCDGCPMLHRGTFVGADTASGLMEERQILVLGLNPGNEEARLGRPFVGPSGRFLRQQLQKTGITSWAMANSLLCSSANEAAICGADQARACCRRNLAVIFQQFKPEIIVPCGNGAWSIFQGRMAITAATERIFVSRGPSGHAEPVLVLPILHPSALIRCGGESGPKYEPFRRRLEAIAQTAATVASLGVEGTLRRLAEGGTAVGECFRPRS